MMMMTDSKYSEVVADGPPARFGLRRTFALLVLTVLAQTGCGDGKEELGSVSGQVTYKSKPVTDAKVMFSESTRGIYLQAELDDRGRYHVATAAGAGLPLGSYRVAITPNITLPPVNVRLSAAEMEKRLNPERADLPKKFRNDATSGLVLEVKSGQNDFNIELSE